MTREFVLVLAAVLLVAAPWVRSESQIDVYEFASAADEARYRALIAEFRCPKCLNTNIAGSDAPIARDLRATVARLIGERGMTDTAIRDFLLERYGEFVLYDPPFTARTALLWLAPALFLAIGVTLVVARRRRQQPTRMGEADEARLKQILGS
jgi:cytochrome c-type biogenesis protein CcmH